jgi:hypothetical protein
MMMKILMIMWASEQLRELLEYKSLSHRKSRLLWAKGQRK